MIKYLKTHMGDGPDACSMNADELKQLSNAYHYLVDAKRDCIRRLNAFLDTVEDDGKCPTVVDTVRSVFGSVLDDARDELIAICDDVIDTVDGIFLQNAVDTPEIVLLYWMKGDFNKYKWEANKGDATSGEKASKAYYEAVSVSQWNLEATDPCLLLVAADYAEHLHDTGNVISAMTMLKSVIDNARQHQHNVDGTDGDGSLLIDLNARFERYRAVADRMPVRLFDLIDAPEPDDDSSELFDLIDAPERDGDSSELFDLIDAPEPADDSSKLFDLIDAPEPADDSSKLFECETSPDDESTEFFDCETSSLL